ncbi:MAG TPA: cysteine desulfurase family protein [bacterium]|nr:cysteine desulfurase family protein [bacterium]
MAHWTIMAYLDFNATTPVRPLAAEEMLACLRGNPGNPSSVHRYGQQAAHLRETARQRVAAAAGTTSDRVIFTSGGTEADNLALHGFRQRGRHLVTAATEHEAVLHTSLELGRRGMEITVLEVDREGRITPEGVRSALRSNTALVSLMAANNETGVLLDLEAIGSICRQHGALFHTDAVQYFGKIPLAFDDLPIDLASISSHKIGGPKGAGALLVRRGIEVQPLFTGGGQEKKVRPGTENLPGIVGFGKAAELAAEELPRESRRIRALRDRLEGGIRSAIPEAMVNGENAERLPNTSNVSFPGIDGHDLLVALDLEGFAVSTGAACHAGAAEPSHVILAMGKARELASGSIRFSLGWETTDDQIDQLLQTLPELVRRMQSTAITLRGETSQT